jgi:branched-chain amino acid transport system permease protein
MVVEQLTSTGSARRPSRLAPLIPGPTAIFLLLAVIALVIGCIVGPQFRQTTVAGLVSGGAFASLAVALVLIYRATEVLNFAQGEMAMATTYVLYQFNYVWHWSYWPSFFLMLAVAFVFGVATQTVFIRPVQRRSVVAVIIVTIALFLLIDGVVEWVWGIDTKFMNSPFSTRTIAWVSNNLHFTISWQDVGTIGTTIGAVIALGALFQFTKVGLAMRTSALRPGPARLVGVRVDAMLAFGWGLAAVLGAIAGVMVEAYQYTLSTTLMQGVFLYSFVAAVIGGIESPAGAVVGGLLFGVFLNLLSQYVTFIGSALQVPVALAVLLFVLLVKPSGLFGHPPIRKV